LPPARVGPVDDFDDEPGVESPPDVEDERLLADCPAFDGLCVEDPLPEDPAAPALPFGAETTLTLVSALASPSRSSSFWLSIAPWP
jgi:hypothetical protein